MNVLFFVLLQSAQLYVDCNRYPNADQKAQNLLNQNLEALRNYFKEKCAKKNPYSTLTSTCEYKTVQTAEEEICVLRRLKAKLFPQVSGKSYFTVELELTQKQNKFHMPNQPISNTQLFCLIIIKNKLTSALDTPR